MGVTNDDRASWAGHALDIFARETMGDPFPELHDNDKADCLSDLLANLRHFADQNGYDFADLDRRAAENFSHEKANACPLCGDADGCDCDH